MISMIVQQMRWNFAVKITNKSKVTKRGNGQFGIIYWQMGYQVVGRTDNSQGHEIRLEQTIMQFATSCHLPYPAHYSYWTLTCPPPNRPTLTYSFYLFLFSSSHFNRNWNTNFINLRILFSKKISCVKLRD